MFELYLNSKPPISHIKRVLSVDVQVFPPVFRIRIHRIHMFLGLPDPDPLVRGMNPDPDPSIIMQK